MIHRLLVANRAEIAARVFRTCRELGIETVAVCSDADAHLPYVAEADLAVPLPGVTPAETYLDVELLIGAALRAGADAVHPGYGFLSESAGFAAAVTAAGLTWIGPSARSIEQMGSKVEAKRLMAAAGVPVLADLDPGAIVEADLPVLVKASAGGGGRGMRVVRSLAALPEAVAAAQDEAASAFGDGTVFVETYVERGRHVEVQVVGDTHGHVGVHGERDCSLQRRHQKVLEETPAPLLPEVTRRAMHEAARAAAQAVDYVGAGTVEFLYDAAADRFFFLEMNTRLQVEHPVTEMVHGIDLVALQIAVAEGTALRDGAGAPPQGPGDGAGAPPQGPGDGAGAPPQGPGDGAGAPPQGPGDGAGTPSTVPEEGRSPVSKGPVPQGHAIEVRLYAEDPTQDYRPQSGLLTRFEIPEGPGVRVDAGFGSGSEVSTHYDAMLAKVVAHAPSRAQAARRLAGVLERARVHGLVTNRAQLVAALRDPGFLAGEVSTAFLDRLEVATTEDAGATVAAALALAERAGERRRVQRGIPVGWRNVSSQPQLVEFEGDRRVQWWGGRDGLRVDGHTVVASSPTAVTLETDGVRIRYEVTVTGRRVDVDSPRGHLALHLVPRFLDPAEAVAAGSLLAPMPGTVVAVPVIEGASVSAGDPVVVLEAMKMQHTIKAPTDGVVTDLAGVGSQVAAGDVLAVVTTGSTEEDS